MDLLRVQQLQIQLPRDQRWQSVVAGLDLSLAPGRIHGLVGESGSGKTMTARALLGLLPAQARVQGEIWLNQQPLHQLSESAWRQWRGQRISIVFQDPLLALNPVRRVGAQLREVLRRQQRLSGAQANHIIHDVLQKVSLDRVDDIMRAYPHQLSGGMRQRVMIAMALLGQPEVLIADEPTAALDPTTRSSVLDTLQQISRETQCAVLIITHDLALVETICDQVSIMYAGRILESGSAQQVLSSPRHPYTCALQRARPRLSQLGRERVKAISGQFLDEHRDLPGCVFAPRCPASQSHCQQQAPNWQKYDSAAEPDSGFRCHFPEPVSP